MVYVFPPCHLALGTELPAERLARTALGVVPESGAVPGRPGVRGGARGGGGQAPDPWATAGPPDAVGPSAALPRCGRPCRLSGEDMGVGTVFREVTWSDGSSKVTDQERFPRTCNWSVCWRPGGSQGQE